MADWSPDLTPPKYGPPNMADALYKMIRGVPQAYQEGAKDAFARGQFARTEELQKPILDENGQPTSNLQTIQNELLRRGGGETAEKLFPYLSGVASDTAIGQGLGGSGGGGAAPSVRSDYQTAPQLQAATQRQQAGQPAMTPGGSYKNEEAPDTVQGIATEFFGGDRDMTSAIKNYGKVLGVDPFEGKLTDEQKLKLHGLMQISARSMAAGGAAGPGEQPTAAPGGGTPRPPALGQPLAQTAQAGTSDFPATPAGTEAEARAYDARADRREQLLAAHGRNASPGAVKAATEAIASDRARAKEIREKSTGLFEKTNPVVGEAEAQKEALKGLAGAKVKNVATYIEAIKSARQTVQVLDEMDNALTQGWKHISTGPGAREWLDIKKAVNNVMPGTFQNVAEAETIDKLNAQLAAAAAKAMTARPSQLEFKAFMSNNPGLLTTKEGSKVLIDLLRQQKQQELELGRMAERYRPGSENWSDVEDKFYRSHPIISPFTKKPIDAKKADNGKWYRPDPDRPGKYLEER